VYKLSKEVFKNMEKIFILPIESRRMLSIMFIFYLQTFIFVAFYFLIIDQTIYAKYVV